jgi:hypothetical protein
MKIFDTNAKELAPPTQKNNTVDGIHLKLDVSGTKKLEGHNPHLKLPGDRNLGYKIDREKRKDCRNRTGAAAMVLMAVATGANLI